MAEEKVTVAAEAAEEKKAPAKKAPAKKTAAKPAAKKAPAKKAPAKAKAAASLTIKLTKSLIGRSKNQIATAQSLGLKKVGDVTAVSYTHLDVYKRQFSGRVWHCCPRALLDHFQPDRSRPYRHDALHQTWW